MLSNYLQLILFPFLFIATIFQTAFESVPHPVAIVSLSTLFCLVSKLLTTPDLEDELLQ